MQDYTFIINSENCGQRLDVFIANEIDSISRSYISNLVADGQITVENKKAKCGLTLKVGDIINVNIPDPKILSCDAENIPLDIVYQDEDMAVINKAKGMVVHPAVGSYNGTMVNALMYHLDLLSSINGVVRPGIVHRIDKDTSGLIVVAKNDKAHLSLQEQIRGKIARRIYIAVVDGYMPKESGKIIAPISRAKYDRKKMDVVANGRYAETDYKVIKELKGKSLVEFSLQTGRTHQIRVHCKWIGHSITGDTKYGGDSTLNKDGQLLHAKKLILNHPTTGAEMCFEAEIPENMQKIIDRLNKEE